MPLSLKIRVRWGYVIAFLMLLISYFLIFYIIRKLANEASWVSHSYAVINNLESIKAEITDAETGVRGYIITKDARFLTPYNTGSKNSVNLYEDLIRLAADNDTVQPRMKILGTLIRNRLEFLSSGIETFQRNNLMITDSVRANRELSKSTMDSIRLIVSQLQASEYRLMHDRNEKLRGFFTSTEVIAVTSLMVALVTILYSLVVYTKENKAKEEADRKAKSYSFELERRVNELDRVNVELQELRSIEKFAATGRIARTMAHEVRNPLTNISLASEQLKEIAVGNEEADILLGMIGRNVNRINQLVSDLLHSTRFAQLEHTPIDVNTLMDETLELANDRIELNQVVIEKHYEKDSCMVYVDKEKMKLAFLNIIVNALEAMEKTSGVLQIWTKKLNNKCIVEIRDNGVGMDEETVQRLFEPYFTSKMKGNGLGLTNTQNIILNHKGNISVKSKIGNGSSFIVTLFLKEDGQAS